ncbi:hypothetical protein PC9H_007512 [Pleurotus ostreatus]|uniref:Proteasome assembly chaperone 2 n=1 Tax=Pleurotus ostreatus TaxID=5322 RepID=A0A8H6ZU24_PLEOS|nr:uncharacterized protein PC9H_007512 [Pleurotus ostreatus]KAF7428291.1 hypothetical protein PC9H_007512 [Pleurotus ostreatus]KAJ8696393.1 hypothetical protein PTI98_006267 [Pleurotus ostreatus]
MFFHSTAPNYTLKGKNLLIPVVSTANLPQLAADILIASLSLQLVGIFDPQYFIPAVGARDEGQEGITTPFELFGRDDLNVAVIQQRSPALKSRKQDFVDELLAFVQASGVQSTLFLSGVDLSNRTDSQMMIPLYHICPTHAPAFTSEPLSRITQFHIPSYASSSDAISEKEPIPFIPGGGLTRRILSSIPTSWSIPVCALLQFVLEGDNRADARMLASAIAKILDVDTRISEWQEPSSWKQGLFGGPHDQTLYG